MFKAVKECMKNWLVTYERLYWYIVVGLAVLAFGVITAIGCAKLEKAEAAETSDGVFYPDVVGYIDNSTAASSIRYILEEYKYLCVSRSSDGKYYDFYFANSPFESYKSSSTIYVYADSWFQFEYRPSDNKVGFYSVDTSFAADKRRNVVQSSNRVYVGSNCNFVVKDGYDGAFLSSLPQKNLLHPNGPETVYSVDAPYLGFNGFGHLNKIASGDTKLKLFSDIYEDFTASSEWLFEGKILNSAFEDLSYELELSIDVELPNDSYILGLAESMDIDLSWEHNALSHTPEMVKTWYSYTGLDYSKYRINATFPIVPNERGEFELRFTFPETEYLLMGDDSFRERFVVYNGEENTYWKAILLSYLHIDTIIATVNTERADSVVYGKIRSVRFERGYGNWFSALTFADKNFVNDDALENMVNSDLAISEREHLKELENRLDDLQNQIDNIGSVEGAFSGELNSSDLWSGFQSLSVGLVSLAPSISALSILTGAVFGFMPSPITGIMSFTLFALCIIAIIKAIRG